MDENITDNMPYLFEEDIVLRPSQAQEILQSRKRRQKRKLRADPTVLWKLPIWYTFNPDEYSKLFKEIRVTY